MFLTRRLQQLATCDKAPLRPPALRSRRLNRTFGANMTSISALSSTSYQSPLQKLQEELQSEVNSGAISSSDQTALSSALSDIDSSLQQSRASDQSGGTKGAPGDLKSKIDDLIAGEVSSGKLTSDQATELQGVFKAAFGNGAGGSGGPGGAGGPLRAVRRLRIARLRPMLRTLAPAPARSPTSCSSFFSRCRVRCRPRLRTARLETLRAMQIHLFRRS